MTEVQWLMFLPQLPSSPSSLRVLVWRRLRAAGALGLQHGVWVLPQRPEHERFLSNLVAEIQPQGGNGLLLRAHPLQADLSDTIVERFRAERDEEYRELRGRCADFLEEIVNETASRNFTFAELEENEQDLQKLASWLSKILARDFCGASQAEPSKRDLTLCQEALEQFAQAVYNQAGLVDSTEGMPTPRQSDEVNAGRANRTSSIEETTESGEVERGR
jgi:hypothetical protein